MGAVGTMTVWGRMPDWDWDGWVCPDPVKALRELVDRPWEQRGILVTTGQLEAHGLTVEELREAGAVVTCAFCGLELPCRAGSLPWAMWDEHQGGKCRV